MKRLASPPVLPDGNVVAGQKGSLAAESGFFFDGMFRVTPAIVDVAMAASKQIGAFLLRALPVEADHVVVADMNNLNRQGDHDR